MFSVIEKYTENVRFCIICNYLSKIIPALQSRCTKFRFGPLAKEQIMPRLEHVVKEEKYIKMPIIKFTKLMPLFSIILHIWNIFRVVVTQDGKEALITLSGGDMRRVLNVLQSTWLAFQKVDEENVYLCVGHPLPSDIKNIINWLLNENYETAYNSIL